MVKFIELVHVGTKYEQFKLMPSNKCMQTITELSA